MRPLPQFTAEGVLPPGDYALTLGELRASLLVLGPGPPNLRPNWDGQWRDRLVDQLSLLVDKLWRVGVTSIFINGSFVEKKDHPNDIDGYFECDFYSLISGQLQQDLNLLDPHKCWTWDPASRRSFPGFSKKQVPMWHKYRIELYPHFVGNSCGIRDQYGNELEFPAAFRQRRGDHIPKGIIKLVR